MIPADLRTAFASWCARRGFRPVRSPGAPGEARIVSRRGKVSVELAVEESESSYVLRLRGALPGEHVTRGLGWSYPVLEVSVERAHAMLAD